MVENIEMEFTQDKGLDSLVRDFTLRCATLRFGARLCALVRDFPALVRDFSALARDFLALARDFSALARDFSLWCVTSPLRRATSLLWRTTFRFGWLFLSFVSLL